MAWSTVTIGMVSSKPEDCGVSFLSRSSYKVFKISNTIYIVLYIVILNI